MCMNNDNNPPEEDVKELMDDYDLDEDTAENVRDIMDEYWVDADDAMEIDDCWI